MGEKVYLDEAGVTVTSKRAVFGRTTYPVAGITSVSSRRYAPVTTGPDALTVFGVVLGLLGLVGLGVTFTDRQPLSWGCVGTSGGMAVCGILLGACGWRLGRRRAPTYGVVVTTAGGEVQVLESPDSAFVDDVVESLNQAIVGR